MDFQLELFSGTLHGACAAYIVDQYVLYSIYELFFFRSPYACSCSVSSLVLLGASLGIDGGGVSQSMNLIWHNSIKMQVQRIFTPFFFSPHAQASN